MFRYLIICIGEYHEEEKPYDFGGDRINAYDVAWRL